MLLTLTLTRPPATDLGFLLHKHPERVQQFSLPFGAAHVFYPEVTRGALHGCVAARCRSGRADPARRPVRAARPVRQRPSVRRLVVHERCDLARVRHAPWPAGAMRGPSCPSSRCRLRRGLRCCRSRAARRSRGGCSSRSATRCDAVQHPLDEQLPGVGGEPRTTPFICAARCGCVSC